MAVKPLLELQRVSAGYGELIVLRDVSISVAPGEIVALIGPNGAGKSTVLKSIFGLTARTGGSIRFDGKPIDAKDSYELLALGISYITQGKINFTELTVEENLRLGALLLSDTEEIERRIHAVYQQFPALAQKRTHYAYSLSGGQQQMLAIGRALVQRPKLLLMDEPSLGLSPKLQQELFAIIATLQQQGIAVLIVEQNAKKAIEVANRTYLLEQGRVVLSGGKNILRHSQIRDVYLGGS